MKIKLLIILMIIVFPSSSFALDPRPTYKPIKLHVGGRTNLSNWILGANVYISFDGFITDTFYQLTTRSYWRGKRIMNFSNADELIRIYVSNYKYYIFEVLFISSQYVIIKRR